MFKTFDIRQQRTLISARQETNKLSPTVASSYYLKGVSKLTEGGKTEAELSRLPELRRQTMKSKRPSQLQFIGQNTRDKTDAHRQNPGDLQGVNPKYA